MTPETLSELKSLLEKARPGPWRGVLASKEFGLEIWIDVSDPDHQEWMIATNEDYDLICPLRNAAPDLIKAVEQRDRYRAALERARKDMVILIGDQEYDEERSICREGIADIDEALKDTKEETNESDT